MLLQIAACKHVDSSVGRQLLQTALRACQRYTIADHYRSLHREAADQGNRQEQQLEQQPHSSWQEKLIALSSLTLCAQGHVQQLVSTSIGRTAAAATSLAAAATAAAGAPAGVSLAFFQIQNESPHHYWLRQAGLADRNVTHGLVAAIVGCYGMQLISPGFTRFCVRAAPLVADGEYWRLLTAAFLHGNIAHCGINAFALWNVGRVVEGELGSKAFTAVYFGSAILGNLASQLFGNPFVSSLGASGALYGIMGGWIAYRLKNVAAYGPLLRSPEMMSIGGTLALNAGLMLAFHNTFDIWAHVGGFVGGAAISALLSPQYGRR